MMEWYPFGVEESFQCADLIRHERRQLFGCELHLSSSKALDIGEAGVGAYGYVMLFA